MSQGEVIMNDN